MLYIIVKATFGVTTFPDTKEKKFVTNFIYLFIFAIPRETFSSSMVRLGFSVENLLCESRFPHYGTNVP